MIRQFGIALKDICAANPALEQIPSALNVDICSCGEEL
jgi:hypothetical protein